VPPAVGAKIINLCFDTHRQQKKETDVLPFYILVYSYPYLTSIIAMDWLVDLESTCSSLGTADGNEYIKDDECTEGVKDLVRFVSNN
jgi:hypothetical protein